MAVALSLGFIAPTPAVAVADGAIACSVSGTFTVTANKVTGNTACTGRAVIPSGITEISNDAFLSATGLTSAFIPNTVVRIGTQAFQQSHLTTVDFEASSTLTRIESAAFQNIPLTSIVIPDSVTYLGNYQFWVNYSLTSVVLPANLRTVLQYTFGQTTGLTSVNLPLNLTTIEANAFSTNTALTNYTYCGLGVNTAALNAAGLTGKTRDCTAAAISLSSTSESVRVNTAVTGYTISSSNSYGGGVVNYSISPNISTTPGLTFDTATGLISGTPTTVAAAQSYTITAINYASPSGTATFTITVATASPPPPPPSVPAPIQKSIVTSISPESATSGLPTPIVISGTFIENIENISINGTPLAAGSWAQTSTSISITIPKGPAGRYSITLYNGSAPLLNVPTFTYTTPAELNWTLREAPNNAWNAVTFGGGKFVAVGTSTNGDGIMSSVDGKSWVASSGVPNNHWTSVAYGNGTFVATSRTGTGNRILSSKDGVNWSNSALRQDFNWGWVKFGNGVFVAAASGFMDRTTRLPIIYYSADGISWTRSNIRLVGRPAIPEQSVSSLGFGNGVFVLTGTPGRSALGYIPLIMTSGDGINWTWKESSFGTRTVSYQSYGCRNYVAMSNIGNLNVTTDPEDWLRGTPDREVRSTGIKDLNDLTYAGGLFLSVGKATSALSNNAITWREQILLSKNTWSSVAYGNNLFVAVANAGSDSRVMTAPYSAFTAATLGEKVTAGTPIAGFKPIYTGCSSVTYSISPAVTDPGLKFDSTTGHLTGIPTVATGGTTYTISVLDGSLSPISLTYSLTVVGAAGNSSGSAPANVDSSNNGAASAPATNSEDKNSESSTTGAASPEETSTATSKPSPTPEASGADGTAPASVAIFLTKLYFDMGSSKVSKFNLSKLEELAKKIILLGDGVTITISGFAQPTVGTDVSDLALSASRASNVSQILRKFGVTTKITKKGLGRDTLNLPSSRRVEIAISQR